jgi:RNA recognition motif-containing protein
MESKLYVGNLSYNVSEAQLRELFSQAGAVKEVALILDRDTRQSKGFGFVEMTTQAEAEKAIQMFADHDMDGRKLTVNIAKPRAERSGSNFNWRNDSGRSGGGGYGGSRRR